MGAGLKTTLVPQSLLSEQLLRPLPQRATQNSVIPHISEPPSAALLKAGAPAPGVNTSAPPPPAPRDPWLPGRRFHANQPLQALLPFFRRVGQKAIDGKVRAGLFGASRPRRDAPA